MSRSAIVSLVVGLLMLGALAIVESHYWPGFSLRSGLAIGLVLTLAIYGALLTAASFRRCIDPWLPTPVFAWILVGIWWIFDFITSLWMTASADVVIVEEVIVYDSGGSGVYDDDSMGIGWAIFSTLFGIGMYVTGIWLTHFLAIHHMPHHFEPSHKVVKKHHEPQPEPPRPESPRPESPKPTKPSAPTAKPSGNIDDAKDLAAAIAITKPSMTDERNEPSVGSRDLARYAAKKLHWKDVAVATNETSLALAEKDPPKALGKRLCESGTLERIEKQGLWGVELHNARMVTKSGDALEMLVAGPTGTLVKRNQTRFCGVITGRLDKGKPATLAVGMFETAK
jgi:hypothetical protein